MSFETFHYPLPKKWFDKLIIDYIHHPEHLVNLYSHYPDKQGFENIIQKISKITFDRTLLAETLMEQANAVKNTTEKTFNNIRLLSNSNTFTITTGHQLCLFTGPLYFIYKIAGTIQLSEQLKQIFPEYNFVPVYWMATEDHDAEEINHFYFKDKKFQWNIYTDGTPAGILNTKGLSDVLKEMKDSNFFSEEELNLFSDTYLNHHSLAGATRYIVNHLFGNKGIVIIDAADKKFKESFRDIFFNDIFENKLFHSVQKTLSFFSENHYHVQANPRKINTFFIYNNKRYLIEQEKDNFKLKHTDKIFSREELKIFLQQHPEYFSPNVLLRPLYQQRILPNIAYIGGAAEIAYWLILKPAFQNENILFPLLIQRPVIFISTKNIEQKIKKLNIDYTDILNEDIHHLSYQILEKQNIAVHLSNQKIKLQNVFTELLQQTQSVDASLIPFVNAELTKSLKAIDTLEHKLNKTIRQKNETLNNQIQNIYQHFFPGNTMQDRVWNFTYAGRQLSITSPVEFINALVPHCSININNHLPINILKQN